MYAGKRWNDKPNSTRRIKLDGVAPVDNRHLTNKDIGIHNGVAWLINKLPHIISNITSPPFHHVNPFLFNTPPPPLTMEIYFLANPNPQLIPQLLYLFIWWQCNTMFILSPFIHKEKCIIKFHQNIALIGMRNQPWKATKQSTIWLTGFTAQFRLY